MAKNVMAGTPFWRDFQNRVLGPILQNGIEQTLTVLGFKHSPSAAYDLYVLIALFGVIVVYRLIAIALFSQASQQIAYFAALLLAYVFVQDRSWLYPWDPLEVIAFGILYLLILHRRPLALFWLLFPVALLIKESAMSIGLWLLIDSIGFRDGHVTDLRPRNIQLSWPKVISGLAMIPLTFVVVDELRTALYKHNSEVIGQSSATVDQSGNFLAAIPNLHALMGSLFFGNIIMFPVFLFLLLTVGLYLYRALTFRAYPVYDLKIMLFGLSLVVAFLVFCRIDEIRGVNYALPFVFHAALAGRFTRSATA